MLSTAEKNCQGRGFRTPPPTWESNRCLPMMPRSERAPRRSLNESQAKADLFHVIHKVPAGDSPYVRAKHVQLVEKNPSRAISLFWSAINSGDRVDSALKDMAVVMKQINRSDEAIEAIKSFRNLCPLESQESLDNVLLELYKSSGRIEEEIEMLQVKLKHIEEGMAFCGKRTKLARSQGKKVLITIEKEYSRLLGNLAWAYLQQRDYKSAEENYRRALSLEADKNKQCNLAICLMHLNKMTEAKVLLQTVKASYGNGMDEPHCRSFERATQLLDEIESREVSKPITQEEVMYEQVRTPSSSSVRTFTPADGDQNDLTGTELFKRSAFIQQDEMVPLAEWNGGLQNYCSKVDNSSSNRGNVKGTSSGRRTNKYWFSNRLPGDAWKKSNDSSVHLAETPRVPFTQPRKCSWLGSNGDQRMIQLAEKEMGRCNRKLLFQQQTNCERVHNNHNLDQLIPVSVTKELELIGSSTGYDWRKAILGDPAKANTESSLNLISTGEWKSNQLDNDKQKNVTKDEGYLPSGSVGGGSTRMKEFFNADSEQNSTSATADSMRLLEPAEIGIPIVKSSQQLKTNGEHLKEFSANKSRKSWADMVEEDESGFPKGTSYYAVPEWEFPSQESFLLHGTPNKYSDDWKAREEFTDENRNSNIILETPSSLNQCESLSQKIESLGLRDCYYTQPLHVASSMNQVATRALWIDQEQNQDTAQNCFSSPLQKRTLDFGTNNSASLEEDPAPSKASKITPRNRLQAFRDITPESPRC